MGVILWYQVAFPKLNLTVSNDVASGQILSDAEITVQYALGRVDKFTIELAALPLAAHRALAGALGGRGDANGTAEVEITLGYLDAPTSRQAVLTGRVTGLGVSEQFPPLGVCLTGYEEAAFRLIAATGAGGGSPLGGGTPALPGGAGGKTGLAHYAARDTTPAAAAKAIVERSGGTLADGATPAGQPRDINLDGPNDFELLKTLARQYGAELLVQDGTVQFGTAVTHPPTGPGLSVPPDPSSALAALASEDALIVPETGTIAQLAAFKPIQAGTAATLRIARDLPDDVSVGAFDFTVLGVPELRAGQLVAASVDGYQNPLRGYRIIELTHSFSPRANALTSQGGYVCAGRAAAFTRAGPGAAPGGDTANRRNTEAARRGSPAAIAEAISERIRDARTISPSVDVGRITTATPDQRMAELGYGQGEAPGAVAPSVDLAVADSGPVLHDKPLAAPFAWHRTGLSVPVYPGMRALLNSVRASREDSVVAGFLWTNEPAMERPASKSGDWWLCLPTRVSPGPDPRPVGKGTNDLTAADGRRVVEAVGLKMVVGTTACSAVGDRPSEGAAEEFLLSHASGTQVRIDPLGNINLTAASGATVTVSAGQTSVTVDKDKATVTVGHSTLSVTADSAAVNAGGASLTLEKGKVAIR
ncbi:hypothetical protein [Streptomyces griseus]|uniref:hypothetical protein n=1 Tax=Streptomyces griseus TaxID=1911 RepID=UPI0005672B26|nr:hypothetical protein [Streptomyces griseus]